MNLSEFEIVRRISERVVVKDKDVLIGIGDDASILKVGEGKLALTTDMLVENVHFTAQMSFFEIGHKAIAVNLSDIAAMGGRARFAVICLGLPDKMKMGDVDELMRGVLSLTEKYDVSICGGDTVSSPGGLVINVSVIGEVQGFVTRDNAVVGDKVLVTGELGRFAAERAGGRYIPVCPRLNEARLIVEMVRVSSMIDVSDGVAGDILRLTEASQVGALLVEELIPISGEARALAERTDGDALSLALGGGEDFELLLTTSAPEAEKLLKEFPKRAGLSITVIGEVLPRDKGVSIVSRHGKVSALNIAGYEHFKGNRLSG